MLEKVKAPHGRPARFRRGAHLSAWYDWMLSDPIRPISLAHARAAVSRTPRRPMSLALRRLLAPKPEKAPDFPHHVRVLVNVAFVHVRVAAAL